MAERQEKLLRGSKSESFYKQIRNTFRRYIYETNYTEEKLSDSTDQKIKLMFLAAGLPKLLQMFDFELFQKMKF